MNCPRNRLLLSLALAGASAVGCAGPRSWSNDPPAPLPAHTIEMPAASATGKPAPGKPSADAAKAVIRGQNPGPSYGSPYSANEITPGSTDYRRGPTPVSGGEPAAAPAYPSAYQAPPVQNRYQQPGAVYPPPAGTFSQPQPQIQPQPGVLTTPALPPPPANAFQPGLAMPGAASPAFPFSNLPPSPNDLQQPTTPADVDVYVDETRTGRFMFGVGVNSNAGVTGQFTIDERNFDITRYPGSVDDVLNGTAWRGAGQGFRLEAQPGSQLQRYVISFTNPYFMDTNVSMSTSAFYYDRNYFDWTESRYGGRLQWGYRLTPDLSISSSIRAENVNIFNPRVAGVEELDRALGHSDLFSGQVQLMHDTRDLPFMPTEGHLLQLSYEQVFGSFDYPRGEIDYYQYFMLRERPDGSGRHTLAFSTRLGVTGSQTPIFENYYAGGFSTLRGFSFRGASPIDTGVRVGGKFQFINSVEYFFPLTADDMIKGVVFCDYGTVEEEVRLTNDNFRVAPGFGLRIAIPALGPAPLALDFAFPVASAPGDDEQTFSFFFGASRGQ